MGAFPNCGNGEEKFETFKMRSNRKTYIQYDYRTMNGDLFSCIGTTLEQCRKKRDAWLERK